MDVEHLISTLRAAGHTERQIDNVVGALVAYGKAERPRCSCLDRPKYDACLYHDAAFARGTGAATWKRGA